MSILVGRKYRGRYNSSMIVKVAALGKREVMVEAMTSMITYSIGDEFLVGLSSFLEGWELMPEERVLEVRVWADGCISPGGAQVGNNLRLTLADGKLINAEVIQK